MFLTFLSTTLSRSSWFYPIFVRNYPRINQKALSFDNFNSNSSSTNPNTERKQSPFSFAKSVFSDPTFKTLFQVWMTVLLLNWPIIYNGKNE